MVLTYWIHFIFKTKPTGFSFVYNLVEKVDLKFETTDLAKLI